MKEINSFSFEEHRHLFAAWCASTAAGASPKCRFKVKKGLLLLDAASISPKYLDDSLPNHNYVTFDEWHITKSEFLIATAEKNAVTGFTFGVAAKMINCYLKACYLSELKKYPFIHPPIDRLLLSSLRKHNFCKKGAIWRTFENKGWSNFSKNDYLAVIRHIRDAIPNTPLWKIEAFWDGHQI